MFELIFHATSVRYTYFQAIIQSSEIDAPVLVAFSAQADFVSLTDDV